MAMLGLRLVCRLLSEAVGVEKGFISLSSTRRAASEGTYYRSMAPLKAANAIPPPTIAFGPDCLARIPPATKPARTGFQMSFFARYCFITPLSSSVHYTQRTASMTTMQETHTLDAAFNTAV